MVTCSWRLKQRSLKSEAILGSNSKNLVWEQKALRSESFPPTLITISKAPVILRYSNAGDQRRRQPGFLGKTLQVREMRQHLLQSKGTVKFRQAACSPVLCLLYKWMAWKVF